MAFTLLIMVLKCSKCDLWKDGIHLLETGKVIIANNFISSINYFLENMIPPISSF